MNARFVICGVVLLIAGASLVSCDINSGPDHAGGKTDQDPKGKQSDNSSQVEFEQKVRELATKEGVCYHTGMCDASAGVAIAGDRFLVANDEDNTLRLYRAEKSGEPLQAFDLSEFLDVGPENGEADLEGAVRVQGAERDRIYWIGSHGRNKNGRWRPGRHVFFVTDVSKQGDEIELKPTGKVYRRLVHDIVAEPLHEDLELAKHIQAEDAVDADLAPKEDGFNIEALAIAPDRKGILIGLRNPLHKKQGIVLWLANPDVLIAQTEKVKWNQPLLFNLDGRGLRSLIRNPATGRYLLIAGPHDGGHRFAIYTWSGNRGDQPTLVRDIKEELLNPEALMVHDDGRVQLLSDNGTTPVNGQACKDVSDPLTRRFFSRYVRIPEQTIQKP